ncbi:MAG TPA: putative metal-binding motif-containing protein [Steroidobacter sp.]|nr:putative metal-binding motif-containing protein [Steroidobacter sp.]
MRTKRRLSVSAIGCLALAALAASAENAKQTAEVNAKALSSALRGELHRKSQLFNRLHVEREQAANAARTANQPSAGVSARGAKTRAGAPRATTAALDPAKVRLNAGQDALGWTHKYAQGDDCDDARQEIHPGASEICDNRDNDCNGAVDEGQTLMLFLDADGDGHGDPAQRLEACPENQRAAAASGQWLVPVGNDCNDADPDHWRECP